MLGRRQISIAIVGAGIGGLAAAAALRKVGLDATVYEQAEHFERAGAGIQLTPNAMKALNGLGIDDRLREIALAPASLLSRDATSGRIINDYTLGKSIENRSGAPYLTLHRNDLHAALSSIVPAEMIKLGRKLAGIVATGSGVELTFADGSTAEADAVIGADGIHSIVRDDVARPSPPRFTSRVAYRTTFPSSRLLGTEIGPSLTTWRGRDRHIAISYVNAKRDEIGFIAIHPEKAGGTTPESWSAKGDLAELRAAFLSFRSDVQAVLAAAPEVHKWGIHGHDPLPSWSNGRIVVLGDACHPMPPSQVTGAAMALEDAVVLARCLAEDECDTFEAAFRTYEGARKPRASVVQAESDANAWMRKDNNPDWLYGYDAWRVPLQSARTAAYGVAHLGSMTAATNPADFVSALDRAATHRTTPNGAGNVVWRIWGKGPVLALMHGGTGSWLHWVRNIEPLSRHFTVVVPDIPGSGESATPEPPISADGIAATICAGLKTIIGADAGFAIAGFSMGGLIAGYVVKHAGPQAKYLVLVGASGTEAPRPTMEPMQSWRRLPTQEEKLAAHRKNLGILMMHDPKKIDDLAVYMQSRNAQQSRVRGKHVSTTGALSKCLPEFQGKLAGIWGEFDATAAPHLAERRDLLRHFRPQAPFDIIPGAGHWVQYEAHETFNRRLVELLNSAG